MQRRQFRRGAPTVARSPAESVAGIRAIPKFSAGAADIPLVHATGGCPLTRLSGARMSSSNLFGIGLSGLNSAQLGMSTTGNNISNAATPGYNRELALFAESNGMRTGNGFIGAGVTT